MLLASILGCQVGINPGPPADSAAAAEGLAIHSLSPDQGSIEGGTIVAIRGQGFSAASTVAVGDAACAASTFLGTGEILCTTPPGASGAVDLVVTEGAATAAATFTYLGTVGDSGGGDTGLLETAVDDCRVISPTEIEVEDGTPTEDLVARVKVRTRTPGEGAGVGVEGQVGYGDPAADPLTWGDWVGLAWLTEAPDGEDWTGSLVPDGRGTFGFAARFRVDHSEWKACPVSAGKYGSMEVVAAEEPVDYCHVQWPCSMTVAAGAESDPVYAWIYEHLESDGYGAGDGIEFRLGVGPDGSDPATSADWAWSEMVYNGDKDGLLDGDLANDEYVGTFTAPGSPGSYDYAAMASADYGLTWTYCDLGGDSCNYGGSTDGYDPSDAGELTVP
jgi:hypothetical protein